jgi:signal transduction histidine kinase
MLRKPRHETDVRLRVEREQIDGELDQHERAIADEADGVVRAARSRAVAVISGARATEDERIGHAAPRGDALALAVALADGRATEDATLRDEYRVADAQISQDREGRRRALGVLVDHERAATDEHLLLERCRADAALASRDDFLGMVSHDLRSLFGAVALGAEALLKNAADDPAGAKVRREALRIQRLTARMTHLVEDLIDVVSIDAGKFLVQPQAEDPARVVAELADVFNAKAADKGVVLTTAVAPGIAFASFDFDRVLQVLANLVSNAIKFTPAGGHISLNVAPFGPHARFSVADSGEGIAEDKLHAVFERFWQALGSDRRGLGLGLYISKCIVDAHGGSIGLESTLGVGSTFSFTLPTA